MEPEKPQQYFEMWRGMVEQAESSIHYWMHGPVVEFTEDLSRRMQERKISRAELARRMGTSRAYITKLLSGDANFTLQTMVKLALAVDGVVHVHIADKDATTRWHDRVVTGPEPDAADEQAGGEQGEPAPKARRKARSARRG